MNQVGLKCGTPIATAPSPNLPVIPPDFIAADQIDLVARKAVEGALFRRSNGQVPSTNQKSICNKTRCWQEKNWGEFNAL